MRWTRGNFFFGDGGWFEAGLMMTDEEKKCLYGKGIEHVRVLKETR